MASAGNQQCASCIGTLSFQIALGSNSKKIIINIFDHRPNAVSKQVVDNGPLYLSPRPSYDVTKTKL